MNDRDDVTSNLEDRWREWSNAEPAFDERALKARLLDRIPRSRPQIRPRLVLAAAAASLVAVLIGFDAVRRPPDMMAVEEPAGVHETGANVILVLQEGGEPIYLATDRGESP
jgi:hypothetical protein